MSSFFIILMIVVWSILAVIVGMLLLVFVFLIIPDLIKKYYSRLFSDKALSKACRRENETKSESDK